MTTKSKSTTSLIIDSELYYALIDENKMLRDRLATVSAVGISAMYHTHRGEAESYSHTVLKGAAELIQSMKLEDINDIYEKSYEIASAPGVLEQYQYPNLNHVKESL